MSDKRPDGFTGGRADPAGGRHRQLIADWAATLAKTSHVPMSSAEIVRLLDDLAGRLGAIACGSPFCAHEAQEVGAALVAAHFVGHEALGPSLSVFGKIVRARLTSDPQPDAGERLGGVLEAVTAGYVRALRERTLAEQESIRKAEIVERRRAQDELRASEARFHAVFTEAAIGIGLADLDGRVVEGNPAFARMLGYTPAEFAELKVADFTLPEDAPGMWESYAAMIRGELDCVRTQKRYRRKDGGLVWTNLTASLIRDARGAPRYTLALVEDVSDRRQLEDRLRHQALHDPLTGLPNRTLFFERLTEALTDPEARIGICYLDLDEFKLVNDTLGHHIGDQLLIGLAERLDRAVAASKGLIARMGGDEFVVLVADSMGVAELTKLAGQIIAEVARPFTIGTNRVGVTASVGIVERQVADTTAADLVKDADGALYWAKAEGPGQWAVYDPNRKAEDATRLTLTASIRTALERREFTVSYQPIVELPGATLQGAEALLRWHHPTLGTLPPDTFIALAEASGVIFGLGRWVIEESCRQAATWRQILPESAPFVSVNLSVRQASATDLVDDVARILEQTSLPPQLLQLELTEGALVEAGGKPLDALQKLSSMGVRIAIDDFGTGYSNLAYLRRLPVDTLKLPASFVREIPLTSGRDAATTAPAAPRAAMTGSAQAAGTAKLSAPGQLSGQELADEPIISALVNLAHTLGLTVTIEGVENREQARRLTAVGCDTAQGWYFARAVAGDDITALLRAGSRPAFGPPHHQLGGPAHATTRHQPGGPLPGTPRHPFPAAG
jgi:diguanylate cyclase (GGDEF)-like protein/PAS domain S-box-containing protein